MKKFAFISDLIFTFFVSALFSLCLFRHLDLALPLALILSALCGALTTLSLGAFLNARRSRVFLKKTDEAQKEKLLLHLALSSDEANTEYFRTRLLKDGEMKRFGKLRIYTNTEFYFLHFGFAPVKADEVASYARLKTGKKKILLCSHIEEEALSLCSRFAIETRTGEQVYVALKSVHALPEEYLGDETAAKKKKRHFRLWFSKANSRRFLTSGALILLTSFLTPFTYYYLIFAVVLLLSAVFIRIFGYE